MAKPTKRWRRGELLAALWRCVGDRERAADLAVYKAALLGVRARPSVEARLDSVRGYRPRVDLERFAARPKTEFGAAYRAFLLDAGLVALRPSDDVPNDLLHDYAFAVRYTVVHDMVHVLTGYDASWAGEAGVWGFVGGQRYSRGYDFASWCALFAGPFVQPHRLGAVIRCWREGRTLGRVAKPVIAERLEERLDEPLDAVRADLGLPASHFEACVGRVGRLT